MFGPKCASAAAIRIITTSSGRVKAASATVSDELTLTNGASFFRTWQGSLVCERGNAQFVLGSGGYHTATAYVVGEDGEAFVDIRRNTVRLSENTRYIRTENFIDAWKNGYSSARQGVSNLLSFGLGTVGLRPPYILQCFSFKQQHRLVLRCSAERPGARHRRP